MLENIEWPGEEARNLQAYGQVVYSAALAEVMQSDKHNQKFTQATQVCDHWNLTCSITICECLYIPVREYGQKILRAFYTLGVVTCTGQAI